LLYPAFLHFVICPGFESGARPSRSLVFPLYVPGLLLPLKQLASRATYCFCAAI
jgi:hypothetical protein